MHRQAAVLEQARAGAVIKMAELYAAMAADDTSGSPWPTWQELSPARRYWWARTVRERLAALGLELDC